MRVISTIPTPWTPYSVMFSRDGSRIAIGGGAFYGDGGVLLVRLSTGEAELFTCTDLPIRSRAGLNGSPTVSGVCFSADDGHLAASTWGPRHSYSPTYLFEVSGISLTRRAELGRGEVDQFRLGCPTGVLQYGQFTITRIDSSSHPMVIEVRESPPELRMQGERSHQHLTNSQMVVSKGNVITGGTTFWELTEWRNRADYGLISVPFEAPVVGAEFVAVDACRRITAIAAKPASEGFVTGGLDGELDAWSWQGRWWQEHLRAATKEQMVRSPAVAWATYNPASIVGICFLCDGERWVTVSAAGKVGLWRDGTMVCSWDLPVPGSPRSLAAHPTESWIAVGVKQGGFGRPESVVLMAEVD